MAVEVTMISKVDVVSRSTVVGAHSRNHMDKVVAMEVEAMMTNRADVNKNMVEVVDQRKAMDRAEDMEVKKASVVSNIGSTIDVTRTSNSKVADKSMAEVKGDMVVNNLEATVKKAGLNSKATARNLMDKAAPNKSQATVKNRMDKVVPNSKDTAKVKNIDLNRTLVQAEDTAVKRTLVEQLTMHNRPPVVPPTLAYIPMC